MEASTIGISYKRVRCKGFFSPFFSFLSFFWKHIDKHNKERSKIEIDQHLFFHCNFAREVWFSSGPPTRTDFIPVEVDGIQNSIAKILLPTSKECLAIQQEVEESLHGTHETQADIHTTVLSLTRADTTEPSIYAGAHWQPGHDHPLTTTHHSTNTTAGMQNPLPSGGGIYWKYVVWPSSPWRACKRPRDSVLLDGVAGREEKKKIAFLPA